MTDTLAVYIHVPFCLSKCGYCDFLSFPGSDEGTAARYFDALNAEIAKAAVEFPRRSVRTVFFGGGTPTLVPVNYLTNTLDNLRRRFNVDPSAEITVEANPETLDRAYLAALHGFGFNRLSVGAQSFNNTLLKTLGRVHTAAKTVEAVKAAQSAGFDDINLDLMFALPGQTPNDWLNTLETAISLNVTHVSCYALTIEPDTPFGRGGVLPLDDETDRAMYAAAVNVLAAHGFNRYEISNFAQEGYECRHNRVYWEGGDYLGLGLGAYSFINGERFHGAVTLADYVREPGQRFDVTKLTTRDKMSEFFFLGLRMDKGVSLQDFCDRFGVSVNEIYGDIPRVLTEQGLITQPDGRVQLTARGVDLSNIVFEKFLLES